MNEIEAKVAIWREKCADGSITNDELREAIQYLRNARGKPVPQVATKAVKAPKVETKIDVSSLLAGFMAKEEPNEGEQDENPTED